MPKSPPQESKSHEPMIVGRDALAQVLGVRQQAISQLCARGMPRLKFGRYDLPSCVRWYVDDRLEQAGHEVEGDELPDLSTARATYYQAQEERVRLETAERLRQLILAEDARQVVAELSQAFVDLLVALPGRLAVPPELEARLHEEVRQARDDLARRIELALETVDDGGDGDAPAARANGVAMGGGGEDATAGEF